MPVNRVLVANRGEIAVRIIRACQQLGIETVLACSEADRDSLGARIAGRAVCIGPASATQSYLDARLLVNAALSTDCDALHPGYGFLAESAELAQLCADHGITFVGPLPEQIAQMGNKIRARVLAAELGLPTLPGSTRVETPDQAVEIARGLGMPVIIKAAAGGGGRGMKIIERLEDLPGAFTAASNEARAAFGDGTLYLERYIRNARHIEVQVLGDRHGHVIHLGERDCSLQRRHQKLVEEAPAPRIPEALRQAIREAGVRLAQGFGYENAGTVEFIVDADAQAFFFLEMNTRIQVEHPVTEMVTGIDLVQEQLRVARGEPLRFRQQDVCFRGHAIECRINAEQVGEGFRPSPGLITRWSPPEGPNIRLDSHCHAGYRVPIYYDSMIGKLIVYGADRAEALMRMERALEMFEVEGIATTIEFQKFLITQPRFAKGEVNTRLVEEVLEERRTGA
ncbi:acetyl-CoA carboxylase biotin carboxylase subunit [Ramlibacter sp. AW1]|uniref:biotin carboxylase n=1 Tax=Ramlibacter aurantiacus TaxID=2801330 RepID=A0A937D8D8_9BURK|nr:acetyl-CoA carboxylase biotin carboxylase subunit [Ramlibacter aurantiacus]MBL0421971.1 acetyl-CoA carboxylase biotin carboxylase subunit [Ramlibacter aurantiacus]